MIGYLKGNILPFDERSVILETGGVGYLVFVTEQTNKKLVKEGRAELLVHTAVKDDAIDLFGFETSGERTLFSDLLLVSGVGPRSALSILSIASPNELESAIASKDVGYLTKVSGIGRKTAEKIVVELGDKFLIRETKSGNKGSKLYENDVIEGLQALGYSLNEARDALQSIDPSITDTGEKIKAALKVIGRK